MPLLALVPRLSLPNSRFLRLKSITKVLITAGLSTRGLDEVKAGWIDRNRDPIAYYGSINQEKSAKKIKVIRHEGIATLNIIASVWKANATVEHIDYPN